MEAEHPKVRLDSLAEYRLVYSTIESLAQEKLAIHFPKEEGNATTEKGGDAYKKRVEALVDEVQLFILSFYLSVRFAELLRYSSISH